MRESITLDEYYDEIERTVDILEEEYELNEGDDIQDAIWETVDSHEWIIYNGYHYDVLENSEYEPDEIMTFIDNDPTWHEITQAAAFLVMRYDIEAEASERGLFE